jgi:hypothetical protein
MLDSISRPNYAALMGHNAADLTKRGETMTDQTVFLTKRQLAERWGTSGRTINRLKSEGALPWTDLSLGRRKKPIVRFLLDEIRRLEQMNMRPQPATTTPGL